MAESRQFQSWCKARGKGLEPISNVVRGQMNKENLRIEGKSNGKWESI